MLEHKELLHEEKLSLLRHIDHRNRTFHRDDFTIPKKDANVSAELREKGNELFIQLQNSNNLDIREPTNVWNEYNKSILYAPNDSEELALGYDSRSAMFYYLRAFEDCVVDCDRALNITSNNSLKLKLLCRKAESLCELNRPAREVCKEALRLLDSLDLETRKKKHYLKQLQLLLRTKVIKSLKSETSTNKNYADALMNFERSQELPCASKSVAIQYNKKWGRHIVATEDIPAGKIIAVEEDYFFCKYNCLNYIYCNNCKKYVFLHNTVPCEHCVYSLYCSESCRKEGWDKYHQFQCPITPFLNDMESTQSTSESSLKFILIAINQVGGIEQMKEQLLEIENVNDSRMKGFSGGIFQHDKLINFFCLEQCKEDNLDAKTRFAYLEDSCLCVYWLAKHTNFFGEKMNLLETEMFLNEDILFIASLLLRYYHISHINMNTVMDEDNTLVGLSYYASFGSLFNHSCDPNVKQLVDSRIFYFAQYLVQKGSQLFLAYDSNMFLIKDKESRQKDLQGKRNFTCKCIACAENWSSICLPSLEHVLDTVHSSGLLALAIDIRSFLVSTYADWGIFKPKLAKEAVYYMKLLSENFTVYSHQYFTLLEFLIMMYAAVLFDIDLKKPKFSVCESLFQM